MMVIIQYDDNMIILYDLKDLSIFGIGNIIQWLQSL